MYVGVQFQVNYYIDQVIVLSVVKLKGVFLGFYGDQIEWQMLKVMIEVDINGVIEGFVQFVWNVKVVGFDGIELYGVNGYLLNQFLSIYFNCCEDCYGGSFKNCLCIVVDIIKVV